MSFGRKFKFILFSLIIVGIAVIVAGIFSQNSALTYAGITFLFGGSFVFSAITVIVLFVRGARSGVNGISSGSEGPNASDPFADTSSDDFGGEKLRESVEISNLRKNGGRSKRSVVGSLLLIFLLSLFAGIFICSIFSFVPGIIFCFCGFCGTILIAALAAAISSKVSASRYERDYGESARKTGKVVSCSAIGGSRVLYKVIIDVDGEEWEAFTETDYSAGEPILVYCNPKLKPHAVIAKDREKAEEEKRRDYWMNGDDWEMVLDGNDPRWRIKVEFFDTDAYLTVEDSNETPLDGRVVDALGTEDIPTGIEDLSLVYVDESTWNVGYSELPQNMYPEIESRLKVFFADLYEKHREDFRRNALLELRDRGYEVTDAEIYGALEEPAGNVIAGDTADTDTALISDVFGKEYAAPVPAKIPTGEVIGGDAISAPVEAEKCGAAADEPSASEVTDAVSPPTPAPRKPSAVHLSERRKDEKSNAPRKPRRLQ